MNRNSSLQNDKAFLLEGYHEMTEAYIAAVNGRYATDESLVANVYGGKFKKY